MSASPRTADGSSSLGIALWRLIAGGLYALALLLIPHDLQAALFTLGAALLCLPGMRAALLHHTGLRLGGRLSAVGTSVLMLGAVLSAGEQPALTAPSDVEFAVATAQVAKP